MNPEEASVSRERYRVHIVVDPRYGERIRRLPEGEPAWIVDSDVNHPVIRDLWDCRKGLDESTGITSFRFNPDGSAEDVLISELGAVDLHHGEWSHDPPCSVLNVVGAAWSGRIEAVLDEFGFTLSERTAEGFVAERAIPSQDAQSTE